MTDLEYIELDKKNPFYAEPYEGQEEDKKAIIEYNKALCKQYPFLKPRNCFTGKVPENYDYSWTELDNLETGWRINFGLQICEEIKEALLKAQKENPDGGYPRSEYTTDYDSDIIDSYLEGYQIMTLKEKFGTLRWYDNGAPQEVRDIIDKYEALSKTICKECGMPAEWESQGWISYYCNGCKEKLKDYETFKKI